MLEKHAKELKFPTKVIFRVEREDNRFYEVDDLAEVVSDPNVDGRKVTSLSIKLVKQYEDEGDVFHYGDIASVYFVMEPANKVYAILDNGIRFEVDNNNKNWSLLLADALEPQVERVINSSKVPRFPVVGLFLVAIYAAAKGLSLLEKNEGEVVMRFFSAMIIVSGCAFFIANLRGSSQLISKLIGPESAFLWGQQEERFNSREERRKNIFWGVFVAFVVSLSASLFLGFFGAE